MSGVQVFNFPLWDRCQGNEVQFNSKSTISFHLKGTERIKRTNYSKSKNKKITFGKIKKCKYCSKEFTNDKSEYCSSNCKFLKTVDDKYKIYIDRWINGLEIGGDTLGYGKVSNRVKRYLFEKFNNKCSLCGWSKVNPITNTIPLEVEHIDGNCQNHSFNNLTLLCPNCHSLTSGHSTSKGNGRRYYREKYIKINNKT